jgi:PelA/Pel-15E family pectate lyase
MVKRVLCGLCLLTVLAVPARAQKPLPEQAADVLARATRFFRNEISIQGGYLWTYSEDLKTRRGENVATATQGWVQPPGTPAVGMAYLRAFEATGDRTYLDAAKETAHALARTQLASGGWDYVIEFDPEKSKAWYYRRDVEAGDTRRGERRNSSTFDDNNSQSALRLLMHVDMTLEKKDPEVRRAVEYGMAKLLQAQYPNGAWSQRYDGQPRNPANYPVQKARYPETWPRTFPNIRYQEFYTFNDNTIRDIILLMLEAHKTYGKKEYLDAARKGGDFILLAQMPEPQPVWAQQYNLQMEPSWARRFEPASVTGGESNGVIRTLLDLYLYTGDEKYLKPIEPAIAWFQRSRLPDGRWARFYELKANKPLYFTRQYELVYTDNDLPTHYSFQSDYGHPGAKAYYERVKQDGREKARAASPLPFDRPRRRTAGERRSAATALEPRVQEILAALDARGRWVQNGNITTRAFIQNVGTLSEYLAAVNGKDL